MQLSQKGEIAAYIHSFHFSYFDSEQRQTYLDVAWVVRRCCTTYSFLTVPSPTQTCYNTTTCHRNGVRVCVSFLRLQTVYTHTYVYKASVQVHQCAVMYDSGMPTLHSLQRPWKCKLQSEEQIGAGEDNCSIMALCVCVRACVCVCYVKQRDDSSDKRWLPNASCWYTNPGQVEVPESWKISLGIFATNKGRAEI